MTRCRVFLALAAVGLAALVQPALAQQAAPAAAAPAAAPVDYQPSVGQAGKDVVWVPTPQTLVDRMLDMVKLTPEDQLFDLGSGDGRTVITAAKRGARAHGIEFNPEMVALSRRAAQAEGVAGRATFEEGDIFKSDFSKATVISLFLLPQLNIKLRPTLLAMKPGTRIVSNSFTMEDWKPDESIRIEQDCSGYCNAHRWTVPAQVAGNWRMGGQQLALTQTFQMLEGTLRNGNGAAAISDARMDGARIRFTVGERRYIGTVDGDSMRGTLDNGTAWQAARVR